MADIPSAALPASGSRGRPPIRRTSQPSGSPALRFQNKTGAQQVNCSHNGHKGHEETQLNATSTLPSCPWWTLCEQIGGHRPPLQKKLCALRVLRGEKYYFAAVSCFTFV